jgi:hypothetical protein
MAFLFFFLPPQVIEGMFSQITHSIAMRLDTNNHHMNIHSLHFHETTSYRLTGSEFFLAFPPSEGCARTSRHESETAISKQSSAAHGHCPAR